MEVLRVLGSERCYLMSDGSKIPFERKHEIFGNRGIILQPEKLSIIKPGGCAPDIYGKKKRGRRKK